MRVLLLGGLPGQWQAHPDGRDVASGIEAWMYCFPDSWHSCGATCTPEFVREFDLIIANTARVGFTENLLRLQQERRPDSKWVSLIEGCGASYLDPDARVRKLLAGSDLVNVINRHTLEYFRALSGVRCEYIGIPYPAEQIRAKYPRNNGKGVYLPMPLRNFQSSVLAALPHRLKLHGIDSANPFDVDIELHPPSVYQEYYALLARDAWAFVDLDPRYTWKRNVLDCAAIGIPCISTVSGGHAKHFFPHLEVQNAFSVTEAGDLLEELRKFPHFYREVSTVPMEKFAEFTHDFMRDKLLASL